MMPDANHQGKRPEQVRFSAIVAGASMEWLLALALWIAVLSTTACGQAPTAPTTRCTVADTLPSIAGQIVVTAYYSGARAKDVCR